MTHINFQFKNPQKQTIEEWEKILKLYPKEIEERRKYLEYKLWRNEFLSNRNFN